MDKSGEQFVTKINKMSQVEADAISVLRKELDNYIIDISQKNQFIEQQNIKIQELEKNLKKRDTTTVIMVSVIFSWPNYR